MNNNPTLSEAVAIINDMLVDAAENDQHHQMDPALAERGASFIDRCQQPEPTIRVTTAMADDTTIELEITSLEEKFEPFARHLSLPNLGMYLSKMLTKMPDSMEGLVTEPPAPTSAPMDDMDNRINRQARALAEWALTVEQSVAHDLRADIDHFWDPESGLLEKAHNSLDNPDTWTADSGTYAEKALVWWWALNSPAYEYQSGRQREIVSAWETGHSGFSAGFTFGKARTLVTTERDVLETNWGKA